jgi:hypothetical protein
MEIETGNGKFLQKGTISYFSTEWSAVVGRISSTMRYSLSEVATYEFQILLKPLEETISS